MVFLKRSYLLIFTVLVLLGVISCGGFRAGVHDNALVLEKVEQADKSLPVFLMKKEIRTTISDSMDEIPGVRLRAFSYEEYVNAPGTLPGTNGYSYNAYLIRHMDGSGAVKATTLSIERWGRLSMNNKIKRAYTWKFHDGDMDGVPDKVVFALITETGDNTLLDMQSEELEVVDAISEYYRQMALELRQRGLEDTVCGGACK